MSEKHVNVFELNGVQFRGKFLTPERSLDVFAILSPVISVALESLSPEDLAGLDAEGSGPDAGAAGMGIMAKAISAAITTFRDLPRVAPFFYGVYHVRVGDGWRELQHQAERDACFGGKASLHIAFVIAAVQREFADFLGSNGSTTLRDLGRVLGLQIQRRSTGPSGDSSSTNG